MFFVVSKHDKHLSFIDNQNIQRIISFVNNFLSFFDKFFKESTLGAGDTFKAGCLYGLLNGMNDDEIVRFASACSAVAISRFSLPLNPPTLDEVKKIIK